MTDIRALCAELLEIIDFLCEGDSRPDCDIVARARAYLAQPEPEELTEEEIEKRFQRWWFDEGSGMRPSNGEDQEEHTRRVSQIAWSNGAYVARWGRPAVEPEPKDKVLARVEFAKRDFDGPSDAILAQYCDNWFYGDPNRTEVDPVDLCRGAIRLFAQIPAPTPVSERLPGPEDCSHPEGECWWFDPASDGAWYIDTYQGNYTCWLPHYALPVPPDTEKP